MWKYLSAGLAALAMIVVGPSEVQASPINTAPIVAGKSPLAWSQKWWQWSLGIPVANNPVLDQTGEFARVDNDRRVFFLAGTFGGPATRSIKVPSGVPIFFPVLNSVWVDHPIDLDNPDTLCAPDVQCALDVISPPLDGAKALFGSLDGGPSFISLANKDDFRRTSSEFFDVTLPEGNVFGVFSGTFPAVSDGFWVALNPLKGGNHVLHFGGTAAGTNGDDFSTEVTANLHVVPEPGTLTLATVALAGLAMLRRRRRSGPPAAL